MASLQKTYKGDLTTSIAGAIWNRIKQADERKQLDKSGASKEVKDAAVELGKDDSDSIPVQSRDVRETIVKIFTPLDGKLLQVKDKVSNLSDKVNLVAGGLADTQKLLVSRNQLLEDKFDEIAKVIGNVSAIEKQREAESRFADLERQLEKGMDLSGTFAFEKTNTGAYGILGKLLSGILGNRFTAQLVGQIAKALIPKGLRSRARLLRKSLQPVRKFVRNVRPGNLIFKRVIQPFTMYSGKIVGKLGIESLKKFLGPALASDILVGKGINRLKGLTARKTSKFVTKAFLKTSGFRGKITQKLINYQTVQQTLEMNKKNLAKRGIRIGATEGINKKLQKGLFMRAMKSPIVKKAIVERLGKEGAEKIGVKLAAGGTKGGFPIVGTGYAVIEGLVRLALGDPKGMMLSFGSGIPAAGWGFAIVDILRDIDREAYDRHIEPNLFNLSDEVFANYFMDAFGISPDQYERGNIGKAPIKGMGSDISSIATIVGVTKSFGDATGFGGEVGSLIAASGLGNIQGTTGYTFDVGKTDVVRRSRDKKKSGIDPRILEMYPDLDPNKPGDYIKLKRKTLPLDTAMNDEQTSENERIIKENEIQDSRWWIDPRRHLNFGNDPGEGGIGGATSQTPMMGVGGASTIEFYGQQGRDRSGEPGVDFSFKDYKNNYNLFPGYVLETGLLYGKGYGNVVVVRSVDPSTGKEFDSLYSHFPDGGIAVKTGQQVAAGDLLGSVGFVSVDTPGVPQLQPNNAGNMSGWHTSVDFFEPGSAARYSNADAIIKLITGSGGVTPHGLLEKLKPSTSSGNQTSLNNIGANSNVSTAMTSMVENGSSERLMTQRKSRKRQLPIVIINNQSINANQTTIPMTGSSQKSNFFEAYNLARYTV